MEWNSLKLTKEEAANFAKSIEPFFKSSPLQFTQADIDRAVAAEREACAKIADEQSAYLAGLRVSTGDDPWTPQEASEHCDEIANIIRARGKP